MIKDWFAHRSPFEYEYRFAEYEYEYEDFNAGTPNTQTTGNDYRESRVRFQVTFFPKVPKGNL